VESESEGSLRLSGIWRAPLRQMPGCPIVDQRGECQSIRSAFGVSFRLLAPTFGDRIVSLGDLS